jgi:hypothetical protein
MSSAYVVPETTDYGTIVTDPVEETRTTAVAVMTASQTEAVVREYFKDIPVMIQIARCESTFRHTLADGSVLRGVVDNADTGVMQINKRYHERAAVAMGLDLDDIADNLAYARHLYEEQGTQPWNASAPCWSPVLAANI